MLEDERLMVEIAKEFYFAEKNKTEIGSQYGCSSTQIARMLKLAKERGLVDVKIREAGPGTPSDLEQRLGQRFPHLLRVVVVPADKNPYSQLAGYRSVLERMAIAGSELFEELVDGVGPRQKQQTDADGEEGADGIRGDGDGDDAGPGRWSSLLSKNDVRTVRRVGFGGGKTIFELISRIPVRDRPDVHFYPMALLGRGPGATVALDPQTLCLSAWARSGMMPDKCHYVTIPPYFHKRAKAECEALANTSYVREQIKAASDVDCAFFTLGAIRHELFASSKDPQDEITKYFSTQLLLKDVGVPVERMAKCSGEVCYSFFDREGREMAEHRYFLSLGADFLARMAQCSSVATAGVRTGIAAAAAAGAGGSAARVAGSKQRVPGREAFRGNLDGDTTAAAAPVVGRRRRTGRLATETNGPPPSPRYAVMIAGSYKLEAVRAALKGRICNCWITDEACAREILLG